MYILNLFLEQGFFLILNLSFKLFFVFLCILFRIFSNLFNFFFQISIFTIIIYLLKYPLLLSLLTVDLINLKKSQNLHNYLKKRILFSNLFSESLQVKNYQYELWIFIIQIIFCFYSLYLSKRMFL